MKEIARKQFRPKRVDGIVEQLLDEILVYDRATNTAHCLNRFAASVWRMCDGTKTVHEIEAHARQEFGANVNRQNLELALTTLYRAGLLQEDAFLLEVSKKPPRRQFLKQIAPLAGTLLIPCVASVLVPEAKAAASCSSLGQACNTTPCCATLTCLLGRCV